MVFLLLLIVDETDLSFSKNHIKINVKSKNITPSSYPNENYSPSPNSNLPPSLTKSTQAS